MKETRQAGRWLGATARREDGMVSAEMALVIPALVAVAGVLLWFLALATAQIGLSQAVREGARAAARGESVAQVRATVLSQAPGASVTLDRQGPTVVVSASVSRRVPLRLLGRSTRTLRASATSWREGR